MKQKYFMLTCGFNYYLWAFIFLAIIFVPLSYGKPIFTDDFGSGNLDNWVIGGRQLGSNTANVVSFEGSLRIDAKIKSHFLNPGEVCLKTHCQF